MTASWDIFLDDVDDPFTVDPYSMDEPSYPVFTATQIQPLHPSIPKFVTVQFHGWRTEILRNTPGISLKPGEFVITAADRGYDIGEIISTSETPDEHFPISPNDIIRLADDSELESLASKREREIQALTVCQEKANELGLPMKIMATELQFDGKKLTVYFSATQYVDFRALVQTLFRIFGTRIWMVWHNGDGPVRDIFTHTE